MNYFGMEPVWPKPYFEGQTRSEIYKKPHIWVNRLFFKIFLQGIFGTPGHGITLNVNVLWFQIDISLRIQGWKNEKTPRIAHLMEFSNNFYYLLVCEIEENCIIIILYFISLNLIDLFHYDEHEDSFFFVFRCVFH